MAIKTKKLPVYIRRFCGLAIKPFEIHYNFWMGNGSCGINILSITWTWFGGLCRVSNSKSLFHLQYRRESMPYGGGNESAITFGLFYRVWTLWSNIPPYVQFESEDDTDEDI